MTEEKNAICGAARAETNKVKGGDKEKGGRTSDCEGSLLEPEWTKVMGVKLDPLILTTEDQGRKGEAKPGTLVAPPMNPKMDFKRTLPDPGPPETGTKPGPKPERQ